MKPLKKNRSCSYYRHLRMRAIKRKSYIYHHIWGSDLTEYRNGIMIPFRVGKWSKGKVHCSCKMCKYEKHFNIEKEKYKAKKMAMQKEMDEYVY